MATIAAVIVGKPKARPAPLPRKLPVVLRWLR
jgi:hypothetical protein